MNYLNEIIHITTRHVKGVDPAEEDRLWKAWLDLGPKKGPSDLQALLTSDVRKEFKARALIVLLALDLKVLPFRWDDKDHSRPDYLSSDWPRFETIPEELMRFAGELVCLNADCALEQQDERVRESLLKYNNLILQFLAVLPEEDDLANELFNRYQINDPVAYMNMEDASGYNPLRDIFCAKNVPNKWKTLADKQMQDRIVAESEGREKPREEWEVALRCYTNHIQMSNYDGQVGYSRKLFASQIRFITGLPGVENCEHELFSSWQVGHIMKAIPGNDLRETRHKLARLVVLRKTGRHSGFSVFNPESRSAAELILSEFGAEDRELSDRLNAMIAEVNQRETGSTNTQRKQQDELNALLSQMK